MAIKVATVLIKNELESKQALEGIVCDGSGYVVEGCTANVFIFFNNGWQKLYLWLKDTQKF